MKKMIIIVMVAALVAGGIFLVRQKKQSIAQASVQKASASMVRVLLARKGNLSVTRNYLARVEPWRSATVGVQITSRIMEILAREGAIAKVIAETSLDQLNETRGRLNAMGKTLRAAKELIKVRERQLEQARTRMAYTG